MPIRVDRSSPVPLYFQVAQHLEQMIESGELPMGTRLENETDLADQLGLSRPTMRRAIEYLVGRGLLVRKRGIGTQVVHTKVTREVELTSLYDDLAKTRRAPSTRVVSFRTEAAPDALAVKLGIPAGTQVYVFERLRYADAEPLALMRNHVPVHLLRLSPADLEAQGLYNLLRANGVTMRIAKQAIGARAATAAEARALGERSGGAAADDGTFGLRRPRARGGTRPPPVPRLALQLRSHPDRLVSQVTALRRVPQGGDGIQWMWLSTRSVGQSAGSAARGSGSAARGTFRSRPVDSSFSRPGGTLSRLASPPGPVWDLRQHPSTGSGVTFTGYRAWRGPGSVPLARAGRAGCRPRRARS